MENKIDLFCSPEYLGYTDSAPEFKHLEEHIDDIFAGNNPDMMLDSVSIVERCEGCGAVIELNFKCSPELKAAGADGYYFLLNRELDDAKFAVVCDADPDPRIYLIGYSKTGKQEPYVKIFYANGSTMVLDITSVE